MRILMISHGYPPTVSGVTVVVQKIAREMVRRGHQVSVVAGSDRGEAYETDDQGVRLIRVQSHLNPFWSDGMLPVISQNDLREVIAGTQPDIVHSHETAFLSWQLLRLDSHRRLPLVATCHLIPAFAARYIWDGKLDDIVEGVVWEFVVRLLNQFDQTVFPTRTQRRMFSEHGLDTPSAVISNGVDLTRYRADDGKDGIDGRYGLPEAKRVLFVSRLAKDKRVEVLIRAMHHVSDAHLILVGRGDDQERLEELAGDLKLTDRVHFLGFVPESDLPGLYRACDLFAIASTCEVQSIPTIQAVASGLPVVAADAAALPELVEHGVTGLLVTPDDPAAFGEAMSGILGDPEGAAKMGEAGIEIGLAHNQRASFDAHERLYESALAAGTAGDPSTRPRRSVFGFTHLR